MNKYAQVLLLIPDFLLRKKPLLTKQEASFLADNFMRWKESSSQEGGIKGSRKMPTPAEAAKIPFTLLVGDDTPRNVLTSLKAKNLIKGSGETLCLTDQGRRLFIEWVTRIPNSLDKNMKMPDLERVLAQSNQRQRTTFTKKASKEAVEKQPFNLRRKRADA